MAEEVDQVLELLAQSAPESSRPARQPALSDCRPRKVLRGSEGARESADRLIAKLQFENATLKERLDALQNHSADEQPVPIQPEDEAHLAGAVSVAARKVLAAVNKAYSFSGSASVCLGTALGTKQCRDGCANMCPKLRRSLQHVSDANDGFRHLTSIKAATTAELACRYTTESASYLRGRENHQS